MDGMAEVSEVFQAPPAGTYAVEVIDALPAISQAGNAQIELVLEVIEGKYKTEQFMDWVGTSKTAKGAGLGKGKMRVLLQGTAYNGLADAPGTASVPDAEIAKVLKGQKLFAVIENTPRKLKDKTTGKRTEENMTEVDPSTGALIVIMNANVKGYTRHNAMPTQQQTQPIQAIAPGAGGFAPPSTGFIAPQQQAVPVQQQAAGPTALPYTPNFQPGVATPPWAQNGAQTTGEQPAVSGRRRRGASDQTGA